MKETRFSINRRTIAISCKKGWNIVRFFDKGLSYEMQNFTVKSYTLLFDIKVGNQKSSEFVVWHEFKSQFNRYVRKKKKRKILNMELYLEIIRDNSNRLIFVRLWLCINIAKKEKEKRKIKRVLNAENCGYLTRIYENDTINQAKQASFIDETVAARTSIFFF